MIVDMIFLRTDHVFVTEIFRQMGNYIYDISTSPPHFMQPTSKIADRDFGDWYATLGDNPNFVKVDHDDVKDDGLNDEIDAMIRLGIPMLWFKSNSGTGMDPVMGIAYEGQWAVCHTTINSRWKVFVELDMNSGAPTDYAHNVAKTFLAIRNKIKEEYGEIMP